MPVIAITGKFCSGKTTVLKILKAKGAKIFCADKLTHDYYRSKKSIVYKKIRISFPEVFDKRANIIRERLGRIVFSDKAKLKILEDAVHYQIIKDLKRWVKAGRDKKGTYLAEVPLLFEKELDKIFDKIILIYVPQSILIGRIKRKFGLSDKEALRRLKLFLPINKKRKFCDFIINNDSNKKELKRKVGLIWQELKRG